METTRIVVNRVMHAVLWHVFISATDGNAHIN